METGFDPSAIVASTLSLGYWETSVELDDEFVTVRVLRPPNPDALSALTTPPAPDADTSGPVARLRQRLCRALGLSHGPPATLIQGLAAIHGYRGAPFRNAADGLRILLTLPGVDEVDWATLITVVPPNGAAPDPTPGTSTSSDRVAQLEHDLHSLSLRASRACSSRFPNKCFTLCRRP